MPIIAIRVDTWQFLTANGNWHDEYPEAYQFNGTKIARSEVKRIGKQQQLKCGIQIVRNYGYESQKIEETIFPLMPSKIKMTLMWSKRYAQYFSECIAAMGFKGAFYDGCYKVSAEHDDMAADYYATKPNYTVGYIHPFLQDWAKEHGFYWDWENQGCIVLSD